MDNSRQDTNGIHNVIFILIAGGAIVAVAVLLLLHFKHQSALSSPYNQSLIAPSGSIAVSIADTEAAREQGLSGTSSLPVNSGKLFVFQTPGNYGFWMKDMNYGLDFVWIDSTMKIIGITPDVAANTYPQIFYPPGPTQYVLEVNAGFSTRTNLSVGEQLHLQK